MSFSGALTTIGTHCTTAGTALTRTVADVGRGEPATPPGPCIRFWYVGDGDPTRFAARTLKDVTVGERVMIRLYLPVSNRDSAPAQTVESDLQAFVVALKTALWGDSQLGGNCADLDVGAAETGWLLLDGGAWRTVSVPLTLDLVGVYTLAQ
jgi:hypothetical protein